MDPIRLGRTRPDPAAGVVALAVGAGLLIGPLLLCLWVDSSADCYALLGVAVVAPLGVWVAHRWRTRRWLAKEAGWLSVELDGFTCRFGVTEERVADAEVVEIGSRIDRVTDQGQIVAYRRTLTLGRAGGRPPLKLVHDDPTLTADPLCPLLGRLRDRLADHWRPRLAAGDTLPGDGWALTAGELRYTADGDLHRLPLHRVAAVEAVDPDIAVWAAGEPEPVFRLPADSPNSMLLLPLVPAVAVWPADDPLGRVISEVNLGSAERRAATTVALILTACSGYGWYSLLSGDLNKTVLLAAVGPVAVAMLLVGAWRKRVDIFRRHQFGVSYTTPAGTRAVRYADLEAFASTVVAMAAHGDHSHTMVGLRFVPTHGPELFYTTIVRHHDPTVDGAREAAVAAVADRMLATLDAGRPVPWVDGLTLTPDGLELPGGEVLPYPSLSWAGDNELLAITHRSIDRTFPRLIVGWPNVLPGWRVLHQMHARTACGLTSPKR